MKGDESSACNGNSIAGNGLGTKRTKAMRIIMTIRRSLTLIRTPVIFNVTIAIVTSLIINKKNEKNDAKNELRNTRNNTNKWSIDI